MASIVFSNQNIDDTFDKKPKKEKEKKFKYINQMLVIKTNEKKGRPLGFETKNAKIDLIAS